MTIFSSSWMKRIAIIVFCFFLSALFIRYQGLHLLTVILTGSNSTTKAQHLPATAVAAIKEQHCEHPQPIKVLTYNVEYGSAALEKALNTFKDGHLGEHLPWSARMPSVRERIASHEPDLIGLQEVGADTDVGDIVPLNQYSLVSLHNGDLQYGDAAILFKSARFELLDSGQFWLSPTPDLPVALGYRKLSVLRYVNWVILKDKNSGFTFLFANTHFDNATPNKEPSATLFHDRISVLANNLPIIVTGDFNSKGNTGRYQRVIGMGEGADKQPLLHNAYDLAGSPLLATDLLPNQRIDHILAGGACKIQAQNWHIDTRPMANGQPLSDHDAIISELIFSPR